MEEEGGGNMGKELKERNRFLLVGKALERRFGDNVTKKCNLTRSRRLESDTPIPTLRFTIHFYIPFEISFYADSPYVGLSVLNTDFVTHFVLSVSQCRTQFWSH